MLLSSAQYRIQSVVLSKKTLVIVICLFLVAFKAAAGSIFIQSAVETASSHGSGYLSTSLIQKTLKIQDSGVEKQRVNSMYLMSHVTGSLNSCSIAIPILFATAVIFPPDDARLLVSNLPESVFKPPKINS